MPPAEGIQLRELLIGIASGLLVYPTIWGFRWLADRVFHDVPRLGKSWKTEYRYRYKGGKIVVGNEKVLLKQIGRWCWASAQMTNDHARRWTLRGEIRGNFWKGEVFAEDKKILNGRGVFQLKIVRGGKALVGHMMWWDPYLNKGEGAIYTTPYKWMLVNA